MVCMGTGTEALELMRSRTPALILLSLELSDMPGEDLLRAAHYELTPLPKFAILSHERTGRVDAAMRLGAQWSLVHPYDVDELFRIFDSLFGGLDGDT